MGFRIRKPRFVRSVTNAARSAVRSVTRVTAPIADELGRAGSKVSKIGGQAIADVSKGVATGVNSVADKAGVGGKLGSAINSTTNAVTKVGGQVGNAAERVGSLASDLGAEAVTGNILDRDRRTALTKEHANTLGNLTKAAGVVGALGGGPLAALAMSGMGNYLLSNAGLQSEGAGWKGFGSTALATATPMLGKAMSGGLGSYAAGQGAAGAITGAAGAKLRGQHIGKGALAGGLTGALAGGAKDYLASTGDAVSASEMSKLDPKQLAQQEAFLAKTAGLGTQGITAGAAGVGQYGAGKIQGLSDREAIAGGLMTGLGSMASQVGSQHGGKYGGAVAGSLAREATGEAFGEDSNYEDALVGGLAAGAGLGALHGAYKSEQARQDAMDRRDAMIAQRRQQMQQQRQQRRPAQQTGLGRPQQPMPAQFRQQPPGYQGMPQSTPTGLGQPAQAPQIAAARPALFSGGNFWSRQG